MRLWSLHPALLDRQGLTACWRDVPEGERTRTAPRVAVTDGQLALEWRHLLGRLAVRSPERYAAVEDSGGPVPHPLFVVVPGGVEEWERATDPSADVAPTVDARHAQEAGTPHLDT